MSQPDTGNVEFPESSIRFRPHPFDALFSPRSVAVIGATETPRSVGRTLLWNLIGSPFGGTVFPVNPKRPNVLGIKAYPRLADIPDQLDLAVIATPAPTVPGIMAECVEAGVKGAIIISAGFKELGPSGAALEQEILAISSKARIRIIGPNCLGVMNPLSGLNATFAKGMARPGNVAFISQSGALLTAILDWSFQEEMGFSAFVSVGSMLDVGWGDLIDYFGNDPRTHAIVIYMESIGNPRAFLSAAREVSLTKPIIVIKAGRTAAAAKAAASHTGSLTGSDEVLHSAFRRCGVLRVNSIADVFHMAEVFSKQPRPQGRRLAILTNAGGPGVLATDALIEAGGELAAFSEGTIASLNKVLPEAWSRNNPVDILGDASPERYAQALEIVKKDPGSDGLLVILTPQDMTDPTRIAEQMKEVMRDAPKPVLASWMGGADVAAGDMILQRAGIPSFSYPDTAARVFTYMWQYSDNLRALYETPSLPAKGEVAVDEAAAQSLIRKSLDAGRTILTEYESKRLLDAYCIPTVPTEIAATASDARALAEHFGFPVAVKLHSFTLTHKTDVGGVKLNLQSLSEVVEAFETMRRTVAEKAGEGHFQGVTVQPMVPLDGYELILGCSQDAQFGPVLLFGTGGSLVEVFRDRALGLPPLTSTLARRLMERTKIYTALKGVRGRQPVDIEALEHLLVQFSGLIAGQPWIKELDINPLLASPERLIALDARVVLHDPATPGEKLPRPAIRPYPVQYISRPRLTSGERVLLRPIRPEDEPLMVKFHESLSERSVFYRYFHTIELAERVSHQRLTRICFIDYDREIAWVAQQEGPGGKPDLLGAARLSKIRGEDSAEFGMLIQDNWQHKGLGTLFLDLMVKAARAEQVKQLFAYMHPDSADIRHLCEKFGFTIEPDPGTRLVKAILAL